MNLQYKASKDNTVKIITSSIFLLFAFLIGQAINDLLHSATITETLIITFVIVTLISLIVFTYLISPLYYQLEGIEFVVKKIIKSRHIEYASIVEVKSILKEDLKGTYRTFGVGGLFGYFGKFRNHKLGAMTWYATQNKKYVMLILKSGEKILITPDDDNLKIELAKRIEK